MQQLKHVAFVLAFSLLGAGLVAQQTGKQVVNPGQLTAGQSAQIKITDPTRAGQTLIVTIWNGDLPEWTPQYQYVEIELDDTGYGEAFWPIPIDPREWGGAVFITPGCNTVSRIIGPAPAPTTP